MGMDVYGRAPSAPEGEYFRANIWSWRPIHGLMVQLCGDILDDELLAKMSYNGGDGPESQDVCDQIANRFDLWLEHHVDGRALDSELRVTPEGRFLRDDADHPDSRSPYEVVDEHLKEWVTFLRHCGGFQVW